MLDAEINLSALQVRAESWYNTPGPPQPLVASAAKIQRPGNA